MRNNAVFTETTATLFAELFFGQVFNAKPAKRLADMVKSAKAEKEGAQIKVVIAARQALK
ncbi:hypothetical protein LTR84_007689 [Exophiala bonariae]|uniref:Uncharacterized protein n=1 Tax=Exophiala bonariae TaxID=1690606 RepID=A0AAV9NL76_9EURO|nr:hypothetical protein LTR84_007689 [Exophiala bonariae]